MDYFLCRPIYPYPYMINVMYYDTMVLITNNYFSHQISDLAHLPWVNVHSSICDTDYREREAMSICEMVKMLKWYHCISRSDMRFCISPYEMQCSGVAVMYAQLRGVHLPLVYMWIVPYVKLIWCNGLACTYGQLTGRSICHQYICAFCYM